MKKRIALLCAGVATVSCINFSLAFANNHGDTEWSLGEWSGSRNTNDILTSDRLSLIHIWVLVILKQDLPLQ